MLCDEGGPTALRARSAGGAPARNGRAAATAGPAAEADGGAAAAEEPMYNARALQLWLLHCCQARAADDGRLLVMLTGPPVSLFLTAPARTYSNARHAVRLC